MIITANVLQRLAALNLSATALQEVATIISDCVEEAVIEARRRDERERKRRYRDNAGTRPGTKKGLPHTPSKETIGLSKKDKPIERARETPAETASAEAVAFATQLGWPRARTDTEWDKFRDWHLAHGKTHKDILAAWRNWCRSPYQQQQEQAHGKDHTFYTALDKLQQSIDDDRRRIAEIEGESQDSSQTAFRLLPPERSE